MFHSEFVALLVVVPLVVTAWVAWTSYRNALSENQTLKSQNAAHRAEVQESRLQHATDCAQRHAEIENLKRDLTVASDRIDSKDRAYADLSTAIEKEISDHRHTEQRRREMVISAAVSVGEVAYYKKVHPVVMQEYISLKDMCYQLISLLHSRRDQERREEFAAALAESERTIAAISELTPSTRPEFSQ